MWIFKKIKTKLVTFNCGEHWHKEHKEFIENLHNNNGRIIHAYTQYYDFDNKHIPSKIHYIIEYR